MSRAGVTAANFLATNAFNQYDPVANSWTPLAPLPQAIRDARAVYAANTNSIYVFGGIDDQLGLSSTSSKNTTSAPPLGPPSHRCLRNGFSRPPYTTIPLA